MFPRIFGKNTVFDKKSLSFESFTLTTERLSFNMWYSKALDNIEAL